MSSKSQTLIRHFGTEKIYISIYNTLSDEAVDIVLSFLSPRTTGRQRYRANPEVADTKDYTVLPVPRSLAERVKGPFGEIRDLAQLLRPIKLSKLKQEDEFHI